jgi:hypothetical protein
MYIPAFIEDDEIIDKLNEKGIRVVSPVYEFNSVISSTAFTTEIALILSVNI